MKAIILDKINQLERDNNIQVLFACESGSRAWGFPSPDSDYDVRFIYAREADWYLSINAKTDVVDLPVNEVLDINGWDIQKVLKLLVKSNAVIFEWMQSPIVYKQNEIFISEFKQIAPQSFSPIAAMHHYLNMAKKKYEECIADEDVKLKRLMYCLRAVLSGLWIAHRKSVPPMELELLLAEMPDSVLQTKVKELVNFKSYKEESYRHQREITLETFLANGIAECEAIALQLPSKKSDIELLNQFFIKTLRSK
jgi:predicted nucleotidyltransferase